MDKSGSGGVSSMRLVLARFLSQAAQAQDALSRVYSVQQLLATAVISLASARLLRTVV